MYQAIVFLPLLGAVLAGIIALAGAHARCPGGSPTQGAGDHIVDLPPRGGAAVILASDAEPEQH